MCEMFVLDFVGYEVESSQVCLGERIRERLRDRSGW